MFKSWKRRLCLGVVMWLSASVGSAATYSSKIEKGPYLTYPGNPTQMTVMWDSTGASGGSVDWGTSDAYNGGSSTAEEGSSNVHSCLLTGLPPGQKIFYRVHVGGTTATSFFYSAPAENAGTCVMYAGGDTRSNPDGQNVAFGALLDDMDSNRNDRNSILLHVADFVGSGGTESDWKNDYFSTRHSGSRLAQSRFPIQPSVGNHEKMGGDSDVANARMYFPMEFADGNNGATTFNYAFDYGPVHVVVIDSQRGSMKNAQKNWAINELQNISKPFRIALYHQPAYSAGGHENTEPEMEGMRNNFAPIFIDYNCLLTFAGHNHYYI